MTSPIQTVLDRLQQVRNAGSGYSARCPAHDDQHASLSISVGDDGRVLLHCHAGCSPEAVCKAIGLSLRDLFTSHQDGPVQTQIVAQYDYRDANGELLFQVLRFDPKEFRQRRPNGKGGWVWNLGDTPRVLYRLPELLAAPRESWVHVVEGEKDVDNLLRLGVVATTCPNGAGKWGKLCDDTAMNGRRVAIIADNDKAGGTHAADVAQRLHGRVAELRVLELPGEGKDATDWITAGGTLEQLQELVGSASPYQPTSNTATGTIDNDERPTILLDPNEHRAVNEAIAALAADPDIYQRGGILVRVLHERMPTDGIIRSVGSTMIQRLPTASLRERLTRFAHLTRFNKRGEVVRAHPAGWLVGAVEARGEWPELRQLMAVSDAPILRSDGTICQTPGYDVQSGVLYNPGGIRFPTVHPDVTLDDAHAARELLEDAVVDFPFESIEHRAAWFAALLTPLARFAFLGPSPLFAFDANIRGAGKGLLVQVIAYIVSGCEMAVSSYSHDTDEMRKIITSAAIAGDLMILLDNVEGVFGNDALDRALTSTRWKDRILGKSELVNLPLMSTWYATGNNIQIVADTTRRLVHIRLDCLQERPEERTGFRHPNLIAWVNEHRGQLLVAALTILSAFLQRGARQSGLKPFGSYEGWSNVVREAVVWVGLPDPCLTRAKLVETSDTTADTLQLLLTSMQQYDPNGEGIVVSEMMARLYPSKVDTAPTDAASVAMRAALENMVGRSPNKPPSIRQVGNKLGRFRRRVVGGIMLDAKPGRGSRGMVWQVISVGSSA